MFKKIIKKLMDYLSKLSVEQEDVVGVDITPGCIRLAQLSGNDDKWLLTKLGYKYIDDATDTNSIKSQAEQYVNKLVQTIASAKITTTNAAVSIPVSSAIIKVVTLPLMSDEELQEAVDTNSLWENAVQLTDNLEDYSIFWQVLKRNTAENQMDLLFVASKLDDIDHYLDIVRQAGLNPVVVDVRCFAIRNALELRKDLTKGDAPIAILEFGLNENYILILHEDSPFISDIYLSDKDRSLLATSDIDPLLQKKIIDRFAMQVNQMLSSYQTKYKIQPIDSILISSTISNINNIIDNLQEALPNISIKIFDALKTVTLPENLKEKILAESNLSVFSSVLGLATRKLDVFGYYEYVTGTNNINLLPNRDGVKNQEKMKFLSRWGVVIFVALSIFTAAWSFFNDDANIEEGEKQLIEYQELKKQKQAKLTILNELKSDREELSGMLEASKNITSNQAFMYSVLLDVNASVPQGVSLNRINYAGSNILTLSGLSISDQNILQFIENLGESSVIDKASLLTMSIQVKNKRNYKSFSIRCRLVKQKTLENKEKLNGN
ncbi:pilus assembly protein PilM [Candidatus Woesearchaeota archaeon]|nr:pilus assembly protein PilM [Candidatus Woesearchaeota archaeon]MBT7555501.1 pilus assembly protein PilM [Candidatus Woesearchaeota archaeon]